MSFDNIICNACRHGNDKNKCEECIKFSLMDFNIKQENKHIDLCEYCLKPLSECKCFVNKKICHNCQLLERPNINCEKCNGIGFIE